MPPWSDAPGLTDAEAARRIAVHGPNAIVERASHPLADLARETLRDPMLWFLAGTAVLYAVLGERGDALLLAFAILPLLGMDAFLHWRTQASTAGLKSQLAPTARVRREGIEMEIPALEIVPGDLVVLTANSAIPADGLVQVAEGLQVDESLLTGESLPIPKAAAGAFDSRGVFAGTRVLVGTGLIEVTGTGATTRYGEIVRLAQGQTQERTPLQRSVDGLVRRLTLAAVALCVLLFIAELLRGWNWLEALVSAATLAIAALPEEFPVVLTLYLGVGVYRLARCKALVRRLVAVENIGHVAVLATDKTGTLTTGVLELTHLLPTPGHTEQELLRAAIAAAGQGDTDPLDRVLLEAGVIRGLTMPGPIGERFPFTEERRRETVLLDRGAQWEAITKGAPETVLALCAHESELASRWPEEVAHLSAGGHKVIAIAARGVPRDECDEPEAGYALLGLIALEDPLRPEVPVAVADCRAMGLQVVMVTGDHPATALAIAREAGIAQTEDEVIAGAALEASAHLLHPDSLHRLRVIARATPPQKLRLVEAFQRAGLRVAVTGDGINDAPALRAADVGIAIGTHGAQTTREVAAIVLLDANFATIVRAIHEAHTLLHSLQSAFLYLLFVHAPLVLSAALLPFATRTAPYLPIHIVWLELVIHPTAMLAFQHLQPRHPKQRTVDPWMDFRPQLTRQLGWHSVVSTMLLWLIFGGQLHRGEPVEVARAFALATLILISGWSAVLLGADQSWLGRITVALTVGGTILATSLPDLASWLQVAPLSGLTWAALIAGTGLLCGLFLGSLLVSRPDRAG